MWRVLRAANRPWPVLSDDPVIDYMVMEAVFLKAQAEEQQAEKDRQIADWKKDTSKLDQFR